MPASHRKVEDSGNHHSGPTEYQSRLDGESGKLAEGTSHLSDSIRIPLTSHGFSPFSESRRTGRSDSATAAEAEDPGEEEFRSRLDADGGHATAHKPRREIEHEWTRRISQKSLATETLFEPKPIETILVQRSTSPFAYDGNPGVELSHPWPEKGDDRA